MANSEISLEMMPGTAHISVPLVELRGITKRFASVQALRGVDFDVRPGEVHALLGQNGAGKSTLIKILSGVNPRDAGEVRVNGKVTHFHAPGDSRAAGIAIVYQELSLVPSMTVAANLFLGREPHNRLGVVDAKAIQKSTQEFLAARRFPLQPEDLVANLKFAYRQLTEIAKALMGDVRVLVLDEPTSSLSAGEEEILFSAIKELTKQGVGIIYVTHRLQEVFLISDRVTVLRDGRNAGTFTTAKTDMATIVATIVGASAGQQNSKAAMQKAPALEAEVVLEMRDVRNDRLRGVDLVTRRGEIVGLAGLIGSGRTEILETVFGLRQIDSGEMRILGAPVTRNDPLSAIRRGVAFAPEDRHLQGLILDDTIERNIALPRLEQLTNNTLFLRRASNERARSAVVDLAIKAPGISTRLKELSGGNQQKVVFGKWIAPRPQLLLLDEPTIGVDVGAREEIYRVIREVALKGASVIAVSSDLSELLLLCDRVGIVANGRIVNMVSSDAITNEEQLHHLVQEEAP
jgi:ribose transport system ATP-binding protein